ncbi:ANX [Musa troglodytarum]|uniref:ANX n=1 Tax=Musa troglodytarum TaxID=320322 RepID=A0A9E7L7U7_9LILI|nr:ANX [Musa troglodytarum]
MNPPQALNMELSHVSSSCMTCKNVCQEIHAAWDQLDLVARALAHRTLAERRQIKEMYRAMFGEDFVEHLRRTRMANSKNEMCNTLYLWMLEPHERDAVLANDAIERRATDYKALIEIYSRQKLSQLFFTKHAYLAKFKRHMDQDMISEPSNSYQKLLLALAASQSSHHTDVSQHIANCDAKRLYEARHCSTGGTDESVVLEIFSKRSIPQLRLALFSYKQIYGHDYTKALKKDKSGEFEEALRIAIKCVHNPAQYYSRMVNKSIKMGDADARVLTRVILGSTDAGMKEVRSAFEKMHGRKMQDAICESLPDGDYRDFILALSNIP